MTPEREAEHRLLEEAALLPEDDASRQSVTSRLGEESKARRDEWCAILAENEDLRLRLKSVDIPHGLEDRLRSVRATRRPASRRRLFGALASLAAVVVLLGSVATLLTTRAWRPDRGVERLAILTAMDHAARPVLSVQTANPGVLAGALGTGAPFEVRVAPPEPGAVLVGGRWCRFGNCPLLYTCWRVGGAEVALYQVRRGEFGLEAGLPARDVDVPEQGSPASRWRARVWTDTDFAYVVVRDEHRARGA